MKARLVTSAPLDYDPRLIGQPLASPARRAVAMVIDVVLVFFPTVIVALTVSWLVLRQSDPVALRAMLGIFHRTPGAATTGESAEAARQAETHAFWRAMAPLLTRIEAPGLPHAAAAAVEDGRLDEAADALEGYSLDFVLTAPEFEAQDLPAHHVRCEIAKLIPRSVRTLSILGVPALYFALFLRSRRGATPGKRLVGIRVARLDGHRLDLLEALERFVGYLHIPGTLGYSLTDLWRDPNRRLPHDRVVNTVVLRIESLRPKPVANENQPLPEATAESESSA